VKCRYLVTDNEYPECLSAKKEEEKAAGLIRMKISTVSIVERSSIYRMKLPSKYNGKNMRQRFA
jgi:hypothetical protein